MIVKNYFSSQRQWHSCDCPVCKTDTVAETLHDLFARLGGIDTIVVNAGANDVTNIGQEDLHKQLKLIDTNLSGAIPATQAAREMAHLIQKKAERGVVPAFLWKYLRPFIGHLPERFSHY